MRAIDVPVKRKLFPRIPVPAWIHPSAGTADEHFSDPARRYRSLSTLFDLIEVIRVNDRGGAVDLNLGGGKFEAHEFSATRGEASRSIEDRLAIPPFAAAGIHRQQLFRQQLL